MSAPRTTGVWWSAALTLALGAACRTDVSTDNPMTGGGSGGVMATGGAAGQSKAGNGGAVVTAGMGGMALTGGKAGMVAGAGATMPDAGRAGAAAGMGGTAGSAAGVDTRAIASARVVGYQLMVTRRNPDGSEAQPAAYDIRGISWSPAAKGGTGNAFGQWADRDLPLMRAANINTIKTYGIPEREVLDACLANGIAAIVTVMNRASDDYAGQVNNLKGHPAILMWLVGNEWNFNNLYNSCNGDDCYTRINAAAKAIKLLDPNHPVATSFAPRGELLSADDMRRLDGIDIWGLNIYSQPGFYGRFGNYRLLVQESGVRKPFFMSEYGADAFNNGKGSEDQAGHAAALRQQTQEIRGQLSARNPDLPCLGGTPFEWNDEWWKFGSAGAQDAGGFPNQGVAMDEFANEDWWGIVDADRKPRQAYQVLKELYGR